MTKNNPSQNILFGLLGKKLSYSFSKKYFTEKFHNQGLQQYSYVNFEIDTIDKFCDIWDHHPTLHGMNVTIPYKEAIIPLLDDLDSNAQLIGAVNTIVKHENRLIGYNSDIIGFQQSLNEFIKTKTELPAALILGTGGSSKAVAFALQQSGIEHKFVSRTPALGQLSYSDLNEKLMQQYKLIINTTPLGMVPYIDSKPDIPYSLLTDQHSLYDLIYNPEKTLFLQCGDRAGAQTKNGQQMLILQAEKSWEIWNSYLK